jgi:hypothetical protein
MDFKKLLAWIPGWLGFLLLIIVGVAMFLHGSVNPLGANLDHANRAGFIIFGLAAALVGVVSWVAGATSKIDGRVGTVGVLVSAKDLPIWAWLADVGTVVLAIVLFVVIR